MDRDTTLTVADVGATVIVATSSTRYAYRRVTAPNHRCKEPRRLERGDVVVVENRTASSVLVRRTQGPCRCPFLLHDPVEGSPGAPARVQIHWLRENEPPGEGTVAAAMDWEWCLAHLGHLSFLSPPDRIPTLYLYKDDRPDLALFRGRQYVLVKLDEPQGGYRAGYYKTSITPRQLAERLGEG